MNDLNQIRTTLNWIKFWLIVQGVALVFLAGKVYGQTPGSEIVKAVEYAKAQPNPEQLRFLTLVGVVEDKRVNVARATSYVLNSMAQAGTIRNPDLIGQTLLVFRLDTYWTRNPEYTNAYHGWEALSTTPERPEPYFHVYEVSKGKDAKDTKAVVHNGGWLPLAAADELVKLTRSAGPILRADWFCATASVPPTYYAMSGVPETKAEYFKALGLDEKLAVGRRSVRGANLVRSGVTNRLRRIVRYPILDGSLWETFDSTNAADLAKDPFADPTFGLKFDAGELIATKPNGLAEYSLFDSAGKRLDAVDPALATDYSVHPPVPLVPFLSCARCHVQGAVGELEPSGLRSFTDYQSKLLTRADFYTRSPAVADQLASLYAPQARLQRDFERDREDFAEAIGRLALTKLKPSDVGTALAETVAAYQDALVTPEDAMRELGVSEIPESNLAAGAILLDGQAIQRGQFESAYGALAIVAQAGKGKQ